jgi:hypothetical protein
MTEDCVFTVFVRQSPWKDHLQCGRRAKHVEKHVRSGSEKQVEVDRENLQGETTAQRNFRSRAITRCFMSHPELVRLQDYRKERETQTQTQTQTFIT